MVRPCLALPPRSPTVPCPPSARVMRKRRRTRLKFLDQSLFGTGRSCACMGGRHPTARGWRPRLHAQGVQLRARSKNAALNFFTALRQASTADCEGSETTPGAKPWAQDQGLGVAAFRNGNFQGALDHFLASHVLQGAKPTLRSLTNLASTYLELRQFEHGLDMAERALPGKTPPAQKEFSTRHVGWQGSGGCARRKQCWTMDCRFTAERRKFRRSAFGWWIHWKRSGCKTSESKK